MSDWLDLELAEHLAPVTAPKELWERVAGGEAPPRRKPMAYVAFPVAAVVTLVLAGALWFMARGQQAPATYRQYSEAARAENCLLCHTM